MTINEKYDKRVILCRKLRDLEDAIENTTNDRNKYNQSTGSKKVTLSIHVDSETIQYELSDEVADICLGTIIGDYRMKKDDIIQTLKQELI